MKLSEFLTTLAAIENTTSSLEKINIIKPHTNNAFFLTLLTMPTLNIGERTIIKTLSTHTGYTEEEIQAELILDGRLSQVVHQCLTKKKIKPLSQFFSISHPLENTDPTIEYIYSLLLTLRDSSSYKEKSTILQEIFHTTQSPYLINIITGDRSIGISYRNIFKAFPNPQDAARSYAMCNNWFILINKGSITSPILNSPVSPQLCQSSQLDQITDIKSGSVEYKYDGVRIQPHLASTIKLFTRRQEDKTSSLPDLVESLSNFQSLNNIENVIFDAEIIPYHITGGIKTYLDQKEVMTRLGKYNIRKKIRAVSLELIIFDILYLNNTSLINQPYIQRRKILESLKTTQDINISKAFSITEPNTITSIFQEAIHTHEGIIIKPHDSPYSPGERKDWLKIKPTIPSFDLVITKAFYGKGQKAKLYSSFEIAAKSEDTLIPVGRVSNGFKLQQLLDLTTTINSSLHGTTPQYIELLNPEIIIEVECEKVNNIDGQISFDFTRVKRIRTDKKDITTLDEIKQHIK